MTLTTARHLPLNALLLAIAIAMIAAIAHIVAAAPDSDRRINVAPHLGGDVLYCVDASMNPVSNPVGAGLRLLNLRGEQMMYVSPEQIAAVAHNPAANTIIAQDKGSYGDVYLSRLTDGRFQLTGQDDHGKTYVFEWTDCVQVTPIPNGHASGPASYSAQIAAACHERFGDNAESLSQCLAVIRDITLICKLQELRVEDCVDVFIN